MKRVFDDKLTIKQQRFVDELLVDFNATQAAIRAGYSRNTATQIAGETLRRPHVVDAVSAALSKVAKRNGVTQDNVIRELSLIGFANIGDYLVWGPDGITIKDSEELTRDQQHAVVEVSETTTRDGRTVRFKMHDKLDALRSLAKYFGMFREAELPPGARKLTIEFTDVPSPLGDGNIVESEPLDTEEEPVTDLAVDTVGAFKDE